MTDPADTAPAASAVPAVPSSFRVRLRLIDRKGAEAILDGRWPPERQESPFAGRNFVVQWGQATVHGVTGAGGGIDVTLPDAAGASGTLTLLDGSWMRRERRIAIPLERAPSGASGDGEEALRWRLRNLGLVEDASRPALRSGLERFGFHARLSRRVDVGWAGVPDLWSPEGPFARAEERQRPNENWTRLARTLLHQARRVHDVSPAPSRAEDAGNLTGNPASLARAALVHDGVPATYVIDADSVPRSRANDLLAGSLNFHPEGGNDIRYLLQGYDAFAEVRRVLRSTLQSPRDPSRPHFVCLVAWGIDLHLPFFADHSTERSSLVDWLRRLARSGVLVRVLVWGGNSFYNAHDAAAIAEELTNGPTWDRAPLDNVKVVIDDQAGLMGSHHQKVLLVHGPDGLTGFCGGMDLAGDRYDVFHDVHARVRGPAAHQLLRLARDRWLASAGDQPATQARRRAEWPPEPGNEFHEGTFRAVVTQTTGSDAIRALGVRSDIESTVVSAIRHATRFIYLEDQYFWSDVVVRELLDALPRVQAITILLPHWLALGAPEMGGEVRLVRLSELLLGAREHANGDLSYKIGVYQLQGPRPYVHSKLWIVDDEVAIVGSANCSERSYRRDSEVMLSAVDRVGADWHVLGPSSARRLRMALWARHLGEPAARLVDAVGAVAIFRMREATPGRVAAYRMTRTGGACLADGSLTREENFVAWRSIDPESWTSVVERLVASNVIVSALLGDASINSAGRIFDTGGLAGAIANMDPRLLLPTLIRRHLPRL